MNTKEYISSGIIESYILGLASSEEAGILECVIKNNAEVREAFEVAQKTLEDLATVNAVKPPSDLKDKIWNKIQQEQTAKKITPIIELPKQDEKNENKQIYNWKKYTIAASFLFLLSIAGNLFWLNNQSKTKDEMGKLKNEMHSQDLVLEKMTQKMDMFSNPDMQLVVLNGVEKHPNAKAMVFWDKKTKEVYLNAENLPKAPDGLQYQLWAIINGKPISAGMYSDDKDSKVALSNIPNAEVFAITLEKQGGSEVPTMENMYVMGKI
ncbi:hypothetical protein D1632_11330 [Chryseobacterium nematophagum]|uniref:Anti-sigma K factor RskA C-terminal domain-containing protein n=1 Tax=Chryseobacterium nematophagum TaxID=2305228 RepID=A0A3M7LD77_9FLAO|nr:anti-sigma factor [Chryseobacterium nematophagum]RMZ60169.1 hypothetical protein D1632_11330 [Chryseobacterium nematophagum]